jgi:hypothetical protein
MLVKSIFTLCTLSALLSCEPINITPGAPRCLKDLLRSSKPQPTQISSYQYNGKTVYLVIPDCCDQYISLYDENCNFICAPSGGFSGKGDGKCPDFYDKASNPQLVWKAE